MSDWSQHDSASVVRKTAASAPNAARHGCISKSVSRCTTLSAHMSTTCSSCEETGTGRSGDV
eukprot:6863634-Pyramimonas_sp.AAC.1